VVSFCHGKLLRHRICGLLKWFWEVANFGESFKMLYECPMKVLEIGKERLMKSLK
jgi:hypothetical protein